MFEDDGLVLRTIAHISSVHFLNTSALLSANGILGLVKSFILPSAIFIPIIDCKAPSNIPV